MILSFCDDHFIIISYSIKISSHTSHHQALAWHYCHYLSLSSSQIISSQKITFDTLGQLSHTFVIPNLIPWCVFSLSGHFAYWQYFAQSIHCNVSILDFVAMFWISSVPFQCPVVHCPLLCSLIFDTNKCLENFSRRRSFNLVIATSLVSNSTSKLSNSATYWQETASEMLLN